MTTPLTDSDIKAIMVKAASTRTGPVPGFVYEEDCLALCRDLLAAREALREIQEYIGQIPAIDLDAKVEDTSPVDQTGHLAGIAWQIVRKALEGFDVESVKEGTTGTIAHE